jgi:hypothetical protein
MGWIPGLRWVTSRGFGDKGLFQEVSKPHDGELLRQCQVQSSARPHRPAAIERYGKFATLNFPETAR